MSEAPQHGESESSQANPRRDELQAALETTEHQSETSQERIEKPPSLDEIIAKIDQASEGKHEVSLARAWQYREEVRAKYGLPECGGRWDDPLAYIHEVEDVLRKEGVQVRDKHEFSAFFAEHPSAGAVAMEPSVFRDATVVAEATSLNDWWGLRARANQLSHESVHALQFRHSPRMPDEEGEREAYYYQMLTPDMIRGHQDDPSYLFYQINGGIEQNVQNSTETNANT